jgi:tetratricopeptide (TPR) repeat protein
MEAAQEAVDEALEADSDDAAVLYMVGRVEQRLGRETALEHLQAAVEKEPAMVAAAMALAEARADDGLDSEALELVDAVLARDDTHMRASLWKAFLTANDTDPDEGLAFLEAKTEELDDLGAATDRVLAGLTRARLLRRKGESEAATDAVDSAAQGGATDPRLLALVAREALSVGLMTRAQTAATEAVRGAPTNTEFRKLLAEIFIKRRDGLRALRTLGSLSAEDPDVLRMSAKGALLVGGSEALAAASSALGQYMEAHPDDENVEMQSLQIRLAVAQGGAREALGPARQLARDAPGDPNAALALGEAALEAREPRLAVEALERLVSAAPEDAEGHYLLGRALRLSNDSEEAESSFRRALELLPGHTDAQLALGRLLLDLGRYEDADTLYQELAQQGGMAAGLSTALRGRLGRIEALVGLGRVDDASVQLENLREEDRERAVARPPAALLALADNQPGDAVSAMRPLVERDNPRASDVALFGEALLAAGETEAANQAFDQALEIDPGSPEALLGKAALAVRAESERDANAVLDRVEEALGQRVRPPGMRARALTLRGRTYLLSGRDSKAEAREVLRRAVELPGAPAEAHFFLGEALSGENTPEAREAYERYLELDENGPYARRARRAIRAID